MSESLVEAILDGTLEDVRRLLEAGHDPNAPEDDLSPLEAARHGGYRPELIRMLVEAGADPNERSHDMPEPVIADAMHEGDVELVRWLFARGAVLSDVEISEIAACCGHPAILQAALDCHIWETPVDHDELWLYALRTAAERGRVEGVEQILAQRPQLVREAWSRASQHGHEALLERLETRFTPSQSDRDEALIHAAWLCQAPAVDRLLRFGASPHARNAAGQTPLHAARSIDVMERLLDAGADLEARDSEGTTPLLGTISSSNSSPEQVKWLIARGADLHATNDRGLGAVAYAYRPWTTMPKPPPHQEAFIRELIAMGCRDERWPDAREHDAPRMSFGCWVMATLIMLVPITIYAIIVETC